MAMIVAVMVFMLAGLAQACDAPVYRYALEKWAEGRYAGYVFYQRVLPAGIQSSVEGLKIAQNITVKTVDLTRGVPPGCETEVYQAHARGQPMPFLVVVGTVPDGDQGPAPVLMKGRAGQVINGLADSPARQAIAEKILAGDCIVWTVVGSGDASLDEPFVEKLRGLLDHAERDVLEPEIKNGRVKSFGGHRPAFPVVTVSCQDSVESLFIKMLLDGQGTKCAVDGGKGDCCPGGAEVHATAPLTLPAAFPIFGRGRVLDGLSDADLNAGKVAAACKYLLGKCSCEVKAQNPGRDLLFSVDWNEQVEMTIQDIPIAPQLPSGLADLFFPDGVSGK